MATNRDTTPSDVLDEIERLPQGVRDVSRLLELVAEHTGRTLWLTEPRLPDTMATLSSTLGRAPSRLEDVAGRECDAVLSPATACHSEPATGIQTFRPFTDISRIIPLFPQIFAEMWVECIHLSVLG